MIASDDARLERRCHRIAWAVTGLVFALFVCLLLLRWPEFASTTAVEIGKFLGGVGTFLALVWLITGNVQQGARFRATMHATQEQFLATYQAGVQPVIVFRNIDASQWRMLNAGKGTAINVDVFGAGENHDWDLEHSARFPAVPAAAEAPLGFLERQGELLAQYTDPFGRKFTSTCRDSTNSLIAGHQHPEFVAKYAQWQLDSRNENRLASDGPRRGKN